MNTTNMGRILLLRDGYFVQVQLEQEGSSSCCLCQSSLDLRDYCSLLRIEPPLPSQEGLNVLLTECVLPIGAELSRCIRKQLQAIALHDYITFTTLLGQYSQFYIFHFIQVSPELLYIVCILARKNWRLVTPSETTEKNSELTKYYLLYQAFCIKCISRRHLNKIKQRLIAKYFFKFCATEQVVLE